MNGIQIKNILFILLWSMQAHSAHITLTVINTNDSGVGSLRQAIIDANLNGGDATINFNIPGPAPHIIVPTTFHSITPPRAQVYEPLKNDNIVIDATTQAGYVFGSPSVVISCSSVATLTGSCFFIQGANNCIIKGLGICNYANVGITGNAISIENTATKGAFYNQITQCVCAPILAAPPSGNTFGIVLTTRFDPSGNKEVTNNIVGGPNSTDGNLIWGNSVAGIQLQYSSNNNTIENNFIGCDITGTVALGGAQGLNLLGSQPIVGQSGPCNNNIIQNNVISGNTASAIIFQGNVNGNLVENNKIGVDITGSFLVGATPNPGIALNGDALNTCNNNIIQNNVIGGNTNGVYFGGNASFNQILSNYIGTNSVDANLGNQNSGIIFVGSSTFSDSTDRMITRAPGIPSSSNLIKFNTIAYNGFALGAPDFYGVYVSGDAANPDVLNSIVQNSIYGNKGNGIQLDNNGNDNQQVPLLVSAEVVLPINQMRITVVAPANPPANFFRIEFFSNQVNRNPITEGQRFIGAINNIPSGATVQAVFLVSPPLLTEGSFISATATDLNNTGNTIGDTSPFSVNVELSAAPIEDLSLISQAILAKYCEIQII